MYETLRLLDLVKYQSSRKWLRLAATTVFLSIFLFTVTACIAGDRIIDITGEIVDGSGQPVDGCDVVFRSPSKEWYEVPYTSVYSRFSVHLVFNEFPTGPILEVACPGYKVRVFPAFKMRRNAYDYGKIVVQKK